MKVLLWVLYLEWWSRIEGLCHAFAVEMGSTDLDQENFVPRDRGQQTRATVKEYSGLMAPTAKHRGFEYVPATSGLLFPPSVGATMSMPGSLLLGVVGIGTGTRCPRQVVFIVARFPLHPPPAFSLGKVDRELKLTLVITATRTSDPYSTFAATSSCSTLPTDLPFGNRKGKNGLGLGKLIGLSVFSFFVSAIMRAFGCYYVCPCFC